MSSSTLSLSAAGIAPEVPSALRPECLRRDQMAVARWLLVCVLLVASMVMLGGYTRLSGSGLSITEWKPLHGTIPPLSADAWEAEFAAYRASPQFQKVNASMDMAAFQRIFWPEFLHRLLGRIVGLAFFIPFMYFALRGSFTRRFGVRLFGILALGGVQGLIGWLMVKSGLVDRPSVSHVRLALHLGMAFLLSALLILAWYAVRAPWARQPLPLRHWRFFSSWLALLFVQIVYGAFMAGLHAGYVYNTWPDFNGQLTPPDLFTGAGVLQDSVFHIPAVQLWHRSLAVAIWAGLHIWFIMAQPALRGSVAHRIALALLICVNVQCVLGVITLVQVVPMGLAWLHQLVAFVLFAGSVLLWQSVYAAGKEPS